jgi:hypothetical protein
VVLDPKTLHVDLAATKKLRIQMSQNRRLTTSPLRSTVERRHTRKPE